MVAKKTPAKKAKKTPTKKTPAKKAAPPKKAPAKKTPAKKASAKKTPAKKASAKKTPVARKAPAPAKKAAPPKKAVAARSTFGGRRKVMARKNTSEGSNGGNSTRKGRARRPRLGNPDADPAKIHREYMERYIGGGAEPTERAYADGLQRAYADGLQQWRNLPGAVSSSASVIEQPEPESGEPDSDQDQ